MGEVITNSYNLFVDTSRNHNSGSQGDDFVVNLQDAGVHAGDGEHIRLTLDNFSMAKTFSNVNANNSRIRIRGTSDGTTFWDDGAATNPLNFLDFDLDDANYMSRNDLAQNFAKKLIAALNTLSGSVSSGGPGTFSLDESSNKLKPESAAGETDNIIQFTLKYSGQQLSETAAEIYIQMFSEESDSFALLGGDRIEGKVPKTNSTQSTKKSIRATIKDDQTIKVQCRYPSQLSTEPYVYIRAPGTLNTNIETKGLKTTDTLHKSDTESSDILGRAVIANNNWVQYESKTGREFFLDIHQKQLNTLRLKVTDARNRPIPSRNGQSTLGNLNFSAVIRFDIIKSKKIEHLETDHYKSTVPARFSNGVVNQLRGGKDTYGVGPGF